MSRHTWTYGASVGWSPAQHRTCVSPSSVYTQTEDASTFIDPSPPLGGGVGLGVGGAGVGRGVTGGVGRGAGAGATRPSPPTLYVAGLKSQASRLVSLQCWPAGVPGLLICIRPMPRSPQPVPQELVKSQYSFPFSLPQPSKVIAWFCGQFDGHVKMPPRYRPKPEVQDMKLIGPPRISSALAFATSFGIFRRPWLLVL